MGMKKWWDGLTEKGKKNANFKYKHQGYSAFMAILSEHIKEILSVIFLFAVIGLSIFGIARCSFNEKAKTCKHEHVDLETIHFDNIGREINVYCEDCRKTIWLDKGMETIILEPSTCVTRGSKKIIYTCTRFPEFVFEVIDEVPYADHKYQEYKEAISPTCKNKGYTEVLKCSVCDNLTGGDELDIIDHVYEEYGYVAPTCLSTGNTGVEKCKFCDITRGEDSIIPIIDHKMMDGSDYFVDATYESSKQLHGQCEMCYADIIFDYVGEPLLNEKFDYYIDYENNIAKLTSLKTNDTVIEIPGYINNIPVKEIDSSLFKNNTNIESIIINEGVETILDSAFKECINLKEIVFPDTLQEIGKQAFYNCSSLRRLNLKRALVDEEAFANCINLRIVEQDKKGLNICSNAFYNCKKIVFFRFADGFGPNRTHIFDKDRVNGAYISDYVLYTAGSYDLVDSFSNNVDIDKVLYIEGEFYYGVDESLGRKTLISVDTDKKHVNIPEGVQIIHGSTFKGIEGQIESFYVPDSVTRIYSAVVYSNIKFYFEGEDVIDSYTNIGGTLDGVTYKHISYLYSPTNKEGTTRYWYYDESNNICEHDYPYINYSTLTYYALGDSITYGIDGQTNELMPSNYVTMVNESLGLKKIKNTSTVTSTFSYIEGNNRIYDQTNSFNPLDIINIVSVMAGSYDFINNIPLGSIEDSEFNTIYGSINLTVQELVYSNDLDSAFIFFMTPLKQFKYEEINEVGVSMEDICEAIKQVCANYQIPVLDLYNLVDFSSTTDPNSDGINPTYEFSKNHIVPLISKFIKDNYKK